MNIFISHNGKTERYSLEDLVNYARMVVWIGAPGEGVYNTITIEGIDTFQCSITLRKDSGEWELCNGQVRTECPRGLMSNRAKACSLCMGRCVNPRTANPVYSFRNPQMSTLLNGVVVGSSPIILKNDDIISFLG